MGCEFMGIEMIVFLDKINAHANRMLVFIGGACLVGMICLTCANILFRLTWVPIQGAFELMGLFGAVVTGFALGPTQRQKGHICADVLVNTFPANIQRMLRALGNLIGLAFFAILAWQTFKIGVILYTSGEVTETLRIIYYPFTFAVALGCADMMLVLFTDFLKAVSIGKAGGR